MILSKAASTPVDGPVVVRRDVCVLGAGAAVASDGFVTVFGVGVGLAITVRVRLDGEVVLLFCANVNKAIANIIDAMTRNLFMISSSEAVCQNRER